VARIKQARLQVFGHLNNRHSRQK
jgi:hypothetical protein